MTDGTSNTLMVVDADDSRAVTWTKPGDFTYSTDNPTKGLVGHHDDGFQALFGDGSVKYISADITARMLVALFTRSGGEVVKLP
jgi:prepilin-type processing-associated H-X9-DG protein